MGQLFCKFFERNNVSVEAVGRQTDDFQNKIESSDIIIISVPIHAVKEMIQKISEYDLSGKLVINFASNMLEGMDNLSSLNCDSCCMHLMFGPDINNFKSQNIIVAPSLDNEFLGKIMGLLEKEGAQITETTPEQHDELMAYIQALSQFSSIALAKTISESGISPETLHEVSSVTFRLNAASIERIMLQSAELWANIEFYNKKFPEILEKHKENIFKLGEIVSSKDLKSFEDEFGKIRDFWKSENKEEEYVETKEQVEQISKENSIAVLGPKGTFTHQAAEEYDSSLKPVFFNSIRDVILAVSENKYDIGIVGFENSIHGTVVETVDEIFSEKLKVIKEVVLPISHVIAGLKKVPEDDIKKIYSHPQALNQCKKYIKKHYPRAKLIQTLSTASAFEKIQKDSLADSLAIGPKIAAETYGLEILAEHVEDEENNQTSFIVISRQETNDETTEKTMLVLNPSGDQPGLLHDMLEVFKEGKINLSKIESRPSREKLGKYIFYVVLDTGKKDLINKLSDLLKEKGVEVFNLGTYSRISPKYL